MVLPNNPAIIGDLSEGPALDSSSEDEIVSSFVPVAPIPHLRGVRNTPGPVSPIGRLGLISPVAVDRGDVTSYSSESDGAGNTDQSYSGHEGDVSIGGTSSRDEDSEASYTPPTPTPTPLSAVPAGASGYMAFPTATPPSLLL